ncbi:MAG: chlorite dismutase family protein [Methyloversatilis discipulorum]|uniref:chlorite dismutase family protein n=1 Tax=Methyloversatilis discipulorum TaxID=1119528 RepID=UPI0026EDDBC7|nr:chlorite dismutase family protein [Methyloversatilis discipulorum]MBT9515615.1 chlorite dismutase family protein [Methyloversatilis discipulorum]
MTERLWTFAAGADGPWRITEVRAVIGEALAEAPRLDRVAGDAAGSGLWSLRGITSNERYVTRDEKQTLTAASPPLGRSSAACAVLIPIRKSAAWWALAQDERRAIMEEQSHHIAHGLRVLPAVARRLHHCRDLSPDEPFDFLTWFEFAPEHEAAFDALLDVLRASPEWAYVEREFEVRARVDMGPEN